MFPTPKMRSKQRVLCFSEPDAHDFGEALQNRFPQIRFRKFDYGELQRWIPAGQELDLDIPLYESLADPAEWRFWVWIEPAGWEPDWQGPNENGLMFIGNLPNLKFAFYRGGQAPPPEQHDFRCGEIWAYYRADDKEHERFLNAVWRISAKLSTNVLDIYDRHTGRRTYRANRTMIWAGHHALEWCRADSARRIDGIARPVDG